MFSCMCLILDVAGMTQVTAGWEIINFKKNSDHVLIFSCFAQSGTVLFLACRNKLPPSKGRLMITAIFFRFASGSKICSEADAHGPKESRNSSRKSETCHFCNQKRKRDLHNFNVRPNNRCTTFVRQIESEHQ